MPTFPMVPGYSIPGVEVSHLVSLLTQYSIFMLTHSLVFT